MKVRKFNTFRFASAVGIFRFNGRVSLDQLSDKSGISKTFLWQVENQYRTPSIDKIIWLCDWMDRRMDDFIDEL